MNTLKKDLRGLTKEGLQIPHAGEGKQGKGEGTQAQPGSGATDNSLGKRNEPVLGDAARGEIEGTRTEEGLPRKQEMRTRGPSRRQGDERVPDDNQKPPRKQRDIAPPDVDQSLPTPENEGTRPGAQEILPRKRDERVPDDDQKSPRRQSEQILGDIAPLDVDQSLPTPENEETRPSGQEILPRKRYERVPEDQKSPRKQSEQILGDIAPPDVDQSLLTAGNEEDTNQPSNMEREREPRKKD